MSKYPPSKRKQQDLQNQKDNAGFMTEVKLEQNNSSVIKSKKEESQDYLSNLWNRLNHENVQVNDSKLMVGIVENGEEE